MKIKKIVVFIKQDNELKKATFIFDGIAIKEKEEGGKSCAIKEKIIFFRRRSSDCRGLKHNGNLFAAYLTRDNCPRQSLYCCMSSQYALHGLDFSCPSSKLGDLLGHIIFVVLIFTI